MRRNPQVDDLRLVGTDLKQTNARFTPRRTLTSRGINIALWMHTKPQVDDLRLVGAYLEMN